MRTAFSILQKLVNLKEEKDLNGKTPAYQVAKERAWEEAKEFVQQRQKLNLRLGVTDYVFDLDREFNYCYTEETVKSAVNSPAYELIRFFRHGYNINSERIALLEAKLLEEK